MRRHDEHNVKKTQKESEREERGQMTSCLVMLPTSTSKVLDVPRLCRSMLATTHGFCSREQHKNTFILSSAEAIDFLSEMQMITFGKSTKWLAAKAETYEVLKEIGVNLMSCKQEVLSSGSWASFFVLLASMRAAKICIHNFVSNGSNHQVHNEVIQT